jgi:hypothetical protein
MSMRPASSSPASISPLETSVPSAVTVLKCRPVTAKRVPLPVSSEATTMLVSGAPANSVCVQKSA